MKTPHIPFLLYIGTPAFMNAIFIGIHYGQENLKKFPVHAKMTLGNAGSELRRFAGYEDSRTGVAFRWMRVVIFVRLPPQGICGSGGTCSRQ